MAEVGPVVIVGAGLGGLCLAHGLRQVGIEATVLERDPSPLSRWAGYRLHINPAGSRALASCLPPEVWRAVVGASGDPGPLHFLNDGGKELLTVSEAPGGAPQDKSHSVDRVTLRQLLLVGLPDVRFDHHVTSLHEDCSGVQVHIDGRPSLQAGLMVLADGAGSALARTFLPGTARRAPRASSIAFKVPLPAAGLDPRFTGGMTLTSPPAPWALFTSAFTRRRPVGDVHAELAADFGDVPDMLSDPSQDYDGYVLATLIVAQHALPTNPTQLDTDALIQHYQAMTSGWSPPYRALIEAGDRSSVSLVSHRASTPVAAWPTSRITPIGDCIHAMPPVGGLGGNAALRDASLLTAALTDVHTRRRALFPALAEHEQRVRRHGYAAARAANRSQRQALRSRRVAVAGQQLGYRIASTAPALARRAAPFHAQARPLPAETNGNS